MSNVKYHHLIVIVGIEDGQVVSTEMAAEEYEAAFPNGSIYNPQTGKWEYAVDDLDNDYDEAEYDTDNFTNDDLANDYVWNAIKRGTEN